MSRYQANTEGGWHSVGLICHTPGGSSAVVSHGKSVGGLQCGDRSRNIDWYACRSPDILIVLQSRIPCPWKNGSKSAGFYCQRTFCFRWNSCYVGSGIQNGGSDGSRSGRDRVGKVRYRCQCSSCTGECDTPGNRIASFGRLSTSDIVWTCPKLCACSRLELNISISVVIDAWWLVNSWCMY